MKVVEWNPVSKTYSEPFEVNVPHLLEEDWSVICQCPRCKKNVRWGDTYNVGEFYTAEPLGVWRIPVCKKCADEIWAKEECKK